MPLLVRIKGEEIVEERVYSAAKDNLEIRE
jgi:hypothetical protein